MVELSNAKPQPRKARRFMQRPESRINSTCLGGERDAIIVKVCFFYTRICDRGILFYAPRAQS